MIVRVYLTYQGITAAATMNGVVDDSSGRFIGVHNHGRPVYIRKRPAILDLCRCARMGLLTDNGQREFAWGSHLCGCMGPTDDVVIDRIVDMAGTVLYREHVEPNPERHGWPELVSDQPLGAP